MADIREKISELENEVIRECILACELGYPPDAQDKLTHISQLIEVRDGRSDDIIILERAMADDRTHGTVLNWGLGNHEDYGFLRPDGHNEPDTFVHANGLSNGLHTLTRGEKVSWIATRVARGWAASDVQLEQPPMQELPVDRSEKLGRSN